MSIAAFVLRNDLQNCETNQSPYCLQYICPNGNPATRRGPNGIERST